MRPDHFKNRPSIKFWMDPKTGSTGSESGFSLIELLIAIAIFGIVVAGIVGAFQQQLKSHNTQQQILSMQQNARAAMYYMTREIKNAGLDPSGDTGAGISTSVSNAITFSMDFTGGTGVNGADDDGDGIVDEADEPYWDGTLNGPNEVISYALDNDGNLNADPPSGNGICDGLAIAGEPQNGQPCNLVRRVANGPWQVLAANIDALNFAYLDKDGNLAATPPEIRSVQITLVARSGENVPVFSYKVTDNNLYYNQRGDVILPVPNDQFRRIFLSTEIRCRNLGLN